MGSCLLFLLSVLGGSGELTIEIPVPTFSASGEVLKVDGCDFLTRPGAPGLPCKNITLALPPGAKVDSVSFSGERIALGKMDVSPAEPFLPMTDGADRSRIQDRLALQKNRIYSSDMTYPGSFGTLKSKGGLRKYVLIDVTCHFFSCKPLSRRLYYSPAITVKVRYSVPDPGKKRVPHRLALQNDITFDKPARTIIYNWAQARKWYKPNAPKKAKGYCIVIPAAIQSAVSALVAYRQAQGYDVTVVTREFIEANVQGVDVQQKIRYYLRDNMADIVFVLLVGADYDMPWRSLVPFNDNPNGPQGSPDISPIPSDLYYAELTDPDHLSWDSDNDGYYGEVYDNDLKPVGHDNPDYFADVHLGRIPFSSISMISEICDKTIAFDGNRDPSYKTASLLAGSIYYFDNENYGGLPRIDGADFMEELLDKKVLDSASAVTLYEKSGLKSCTYPCTAPLTQGNQIGFWQRKGIMYECHHGNDTMYARKVWAWDDGDSIAENNEFQWPTCLQNSDVYQLDNAFPATTYLRSCLCGKPEVASLGAMLLYRGSSAVVCSSRIAWLAFADPGGMPFHFLERLMKRPRSCDGLVGAAHDLSRCDFMKIAGFWIIPYHYNLFGDPALRQFGRLVDVGTLPYLPARQP
jgi:hypothetical protein